MLSFAYCFPIFVFRISRRTGAWASDYMRMALQKINVSLVHVLGITACLAFAGLADPIPPAPNSEGLVSVKGSGAKGDGVTDDTAAIQTALDEAAKSGGRAYLPPAKYLVKGSLRIPPGVMLQGTLDAPVWSEPLKGSIILATGGRDHEDATPLFDLGHSAHVLAPEGDPLSAIAVATKGLTDAGLITICALPSKTRAERAAVRDRVGPTRFVEVFVNTDPALCRERRPDADFTGFEAPDAADLTVPLDQSRVERAVDKIIELLAQRGQVDLG